MDKQDRIDGLRRELTYYNARGDDHKARQVRAQLADLEPKKKKDEVVETTATEPVVEKATVKRQPARRAAKE